MTGWLTLIILIILSLSTTIGLTYYFHTKNVHNFFIKNVLPSLITILIISITLIPYGIHADNPVHGSILIMFGIGLMFLSIISELIISIILKLG